MDSAHGTEEEEAAAAEEALSETVKKGEGKIKVGQKQMIGYFTP